MRVLVVTAVAAEADSVAAGLTGIGATPVVDVLAAGVGPAAAAEAMEGFGVAEAAAAHRVPVLEIRAISNPVGPRDRAAWRIGQALDSLRYAFQLLAPVLEETP